MKSSRLKLGTITRWGLSAVSAVWVLGGIWVFYIQPTDAALMLRVSQQSELTRCRKLPSSDARYQCTAKIMLARDNMSFNQVATIVLPPVGLLIGYWLVNSFLTARRNRKSSEIARDFSQKRMEEWREHLKQMRATLETQKKAAGAGQGPAKLSATRSPLAKRR